MNPPTQSTATHTPTPYFVGENANGFTGMSVQYEDGRIAHICSDHETDDEARDVQTISQPT